MHDPQDTLDAAINRASEITWWNRGMTKLTEVAGPDAARSFVSDEIIEQKGPYVEFVDAPQFHSDPANKILNDLGYSQELRDAVVEELFGGAEGGSLYQHQAETIQAIEADTNDNILAVPTATGKTESFFFPILNHCLSSDESGLKSLIVYPMKTLGVDQLNRFIAYLDQINRYRDPEDRITIGIWDSDTPSSVGTREHEIEEGSYIRGLECPRDEEEKLRVLNPSTVGTHNNTYGWIRVTREAIRNGVDILLTNPEALDHMFVSDNPKTRGILGESPSEQPVEHIVFDEAHVWSGISGASIRLLSERLKQFYADCDPQVTMVSATVDNPAELAQQLTGTPASDINSIGFTPREFPTTDTPKFDRLKPCDVAELAGVLEFAVSDQTGGDPRDYGLGDALATARTVGLVTEGPTGSIEIPDTHAWVRASVNNAAEAAVARDSIDEHLGLATTAAGREALAEELLEASGLYSDWFDFVVDEVPEVAEFTDWFDEDTTGEVGFREYTALVEELVARGVTTPTGTLETVMTFGRLAGMITEKYHVFLKPPTQAYICQSCDDVTRDKHCQSCGDRNQELQFCRRCHHPHIEVTQEEIGDTAESDADGNTFRPYDHVGPVDNCPGCGKWPNLTDIGVPTATLLSYMLTEICRTSPSKKTLVFSDSHASAESVGDRIIGTEYGLMAETLYIQELITADGVKDNYELFRSVSDRLRKAYWEPLIQNELDEDGTAQNVLNTLLDDIENHAMLSNAEHLTKNALVTVDALTDFEDPETLIVAHATFTLFTTDPGVGFDKNTISIPGLTLPKLIDRVANRTGFDRETVDSVIETALQPLIEHGVIADQTWEKVRQSVANANVGADKQEATFDYLERCRQIFNDRGITATGEVESGVLSRSVRQDESDIRLLQYTSFCTECYESYPATASTALKRCPNCESALDTYQRFVEESDGSLLADPGYAKTESEWPYALDHWAHDVTTPIRDGRNPEFIAAGIHKGNIPHTLRGAIEEGFRKDDPDINIVSATPTMELGVDIGTLDTVTQVGMPPTLTNYVQRSGRTGRTRGSSSLVMTAIRGDHPVDSHHYSNLDAYLNEFEPVRVPDPYDFDELLVGHVVTEVFAYLARNRHHSNVFDRMYTLNEVNQNLAAFVSDVEENLGILIEFLLDARRNEIETHLEEIFGVRGLEAFEQAFVDTGPLSVDNRVEKVFSRITTMSGSAETNKAFTEQNNRLDQWLSELGYLANYRSFGQKFPVRFRDRSEQIQFESPGRLYDMYPGPENDLGSLITLHGSKYIVDDVHGSSTPLTTVMVCQNDDCDRPFESYDLGVTTCPHCRGELIETNVHGVSSVECKPARGGQKRYRTRSLMTTHVSIAATASRETTTAQLFDLDCEVGYTSMEVTDFVYAFERGHSSSATTDTLRSEALIERDSSTDDSHKSWEERLEDVDTEEYAPVGQQYHTQGLTITFDLAPIESRLETLEHASASWPQALVSLEQALEQAIAVTAQCDRQDFRVAGSKEADTVVVNIVDSRQGGNGITWQVRNALADIERAVQEIGDCDRCEDYCDECLLLARTPAHYLENNLLHNQTLQSVVGGGDT